MLLPKQLSLVGALVSASLLSAYAPQAHAVKYSVRDLGTNAQVNDLSDTGEAVGVTSEGAAYWPVTGPVQTFPLPSDTSLRAAYGPSNAGDVVAWCFRSTANTATDYQRTFIWNIKTGQSTEIKPAGGIVRAMTKSGAVIADSYPPSAWNAQTGYTYLNSSTPGAAEGDVFNFFAGQDGAGNVYYNGLQTAVSASGKPSTVFTWQPGVGVKNLLNGGKGFLTNPYATGVSSKGLIVGIAPTADSYSGKRFIWASKLGFVGLPTTIYPKGVNDSGRVIGSGALTKNGAPEGVTWTLLGGTQRLTSLLDSKSKAYTITDAFIINAQGQIAAYATLASAPTQLHSVILTPTP